MVSMQIPSLSVGEIKTLTLPEAWIKWDDPKNRTTSYYWNGKALNAKSSRNICMQSWHARFAERSKNVLNTDKELRILHPRQLPTARFRGFTFVVLALHTHSQPWWVKNIIWFLSIIHHFKIPLIFSIIVAHACSLPCATVPSPETVNMHNIFPIMYSGRIVWPDVLDGQLCQ